MAKMIRKRRVMEEISFGVLVANQVEIRLDNTRKNTTIKFFVHFIYIHNILEDVRDRIARIRAIQNQLSSRHSSYRSY